MAVLFSHRNAFSCTYGDSISAHRTTHQMNRELSRLLAQWEAILLSRRIRKINNAAAMRLYYLARKNDTL